MFFEQLEDRRLLAGLDDLIDQAIQTVSEAPRPPWQGSITAGASRVFDVNSEGVFAVRRELVIVDAATPNYQEMLNDLTANSGPGRKIEALMIDSDRDGVALIGQILAQHSNLDAIHVISHGAAGAVQLGNVTLRADNVEQYADLLRGWSNSLKEDGDILFYGCDLASDVGGQSLVDRIAELTGADVAASTDATGHAARGGDWDFEYNTGDIDASIPFTPALMAGWNGKLALEDFKAGSYVIDMGQPTQTINNGIRPYGLIYELTMNHSVPVSWAIDPTKDYNFQTQGANTPAEPIDTIGDTIDFTATTTSGSKNYRGGSYIINAEFIDTAVLNTINKWRAAGVVVDEIVADFSAEIYDEISYFPKTVLETQNGGLAETYLVNAGIFSIAGAPAPIDVEAIEVSPGVYELDPPVEVWKDYPAVFSGPLALNLCYDIFVIPHAEPSSNWTQDEQQRFLDFVTDEAGGVWAADHTVSEIEGQIDIDNDGNPDTLFLSTNGLVWYKDHANSPTTPYRYVNGQSGTYDTAADPEMQIMGRYDGAITNGSEHTYVPDGGPMRPTTTVSLIDPDHVLDPTPASDTDPRNEVFLTAYGPAFGDPDNGHIMYMAGHSLTRGTLSEQVAGQRTFFNFLMTEGIRRQPNIVPTLPPDIVASEPATLEATLTGGSGTYSYQWLSSSGGIFSTESGTAFAGDTITTEFQLTSPEDTIRLIVTDACGRQTIFFDTISDSPPTLDLDGDDTTTPPGDTGFNGYWQAGGTIVPTTDPDVVVTDAGGVITSATVDLTNRLDGANETLLIDQVLAGSLGITVTSDGDGGFILTGSATLAEYEQLLSTVQYTNALNNPTRDDRIIEFTVNDGASDSNVAVSTLVLNQVPCTVDFTLSDNTTTTNFYLENDTIFVRVEDLSPSFNPGPNTSVSITITTSTGDSETFSISETAPDSGIFTGSIPSSTAGGLGINDGTLNAPDDADLTVTYSDPSEPGDTCMAFATIVGVLEKQLYLTDPGPAGNPNQGMDRENPVADGDTTTSRTGEIKAVNADSDASGMLAWSNNGNKDLEYAEWTGSDFGVQNTFAADRDDFTVMSGAASATRDEKIVIGVHNDTRVTGAVWNGSSWTEINPGGAGTQLADISNNDYNSAEVAYEGLSDDAVAVWATTSGLRYSVWNGTSWTSTASITSSNANEPLQMRLAADPNSDEMVLVVSFDGGNDYAYVWNGSSWGNEKLLDSGSVNTDIYVAYEQQSGDALVVYGDDTTATSVAYHTWNGAWSGTESKLAIPAGAEGTVMWTVLASDPNTDRIALGVVTNDTANGGDGNTRADVWLSVWDGSAWVNTIEAADNLRENTKGLNVAVGFESSSAEALAVYGSPDGNDDAIRYRTWADGSGWSTQTTLDGQATSGVDNRPHAMTLESNPFSDQIMLTILDRDKDIATLLWEGSSFASPIEMEVDVREDFGQPFEFMWDENLSGPFSTFSFGINETTTSGVDTYIEQANPTNEFADENSMKVREDGAQDKVSLLRFDLSTLTGDQVDGATLRVYVNNETNNTIDIFRLTSSFTETATWNTQPTWNTTSRGSFVPSTNNQYWDIDITSLVQDWLDFANSGGTSGFENFGIAIVSRGDVNNDEAQIRTFENGTDEQPLLDIQTSTAGTASTTFTQNVNMTSNFIMPDTGDVVITTYIEVVSGMFLNPPDIDVTLNETGTAPDFTLSITDPPTVTSLGGNIYELQWTADVSGLQTIEAGNGLELEITTNETAFGFEVLYDSATYPSNVEVQTTTTIFVSSHQIYDAPYPGGSVISNAIPGQTVYVRTTVTDPFGADDITDLDLLIEDQTPTTIVSTTLTDGDVVDPSPINSTDNYKTYEYTWVVPTGGNYDITVQANEGTEGIFDIDSTPLSVGGTPDLIVSKDDGGITAEVGDTVVYTITYENIGDGNATGVVITETLPANTSFNAGASTAGWTHIGGGVYEIDAPDIPDPITIGATGTVLFAVDVLALPAGVTQIDNAVSIADDGAETNTANNDGADSTPITAAPDLSITKDDGGASVSAGGSVTYTLTIENNGTQDATGVVITDTLPPNTTINAASLTAGWSLVSGVTYQYNYGNLAVGASDTVDIILDMVSPVPAGVEQITNPVTIADDGTNGPDENPADNGDSDVTPVDAAPDLVITKDDGGAATLPGGVVAYTITYTNVGTQDATGVNIEDTVPANTTFNVGLSTPGWDNDAGVLNYLIGDLAVGESGSITVAFDVDLGHTPGVDILNTADIFDDGLSGPDLNPGDNTDTDNTPTAATPDADLAITKDDGLTLVEPGDSITYTITVENFGPDPVADAIVTDNFPADLTGISWTVATTGGATSTAAPSGSGNINDTIDIPVGATVVYTVSATVAASADGTIQNVASVTKANLADPDLSNNTDDDIDTVDRPADLELSKSVVLLSDNDGSGVGNYTPGDTVQFTVVVTNDPASPFDATGVQATDILPSGFTYVSDDAASNGYSYTAGTGLWDIGSLAIGASATLNITATVNANGVYTNVAEISAADGSDPDSTPNNAVPTEDDYDTAAITRTPKADLELSKTMALTNDVDGSGSFSPGDQVTFAVSLFNRGPNQATGVTVDDLLPAGYTYVSDNALGDYDDTTGVWTVGSINVLQTITLNIVATINSGQPASAYTNYAEVASSNGFEPDSTPGDGSTTDDDDATVAPPISDLSLDKVLALAADNDGSGQLSIGDTVTFTLTLSNAGPDFATGITVEDTLPPGYTFVSDNGGAATTESGGVVTWNPGSLGVGGTKTLVITATVNGGFDPAAGDYENYAEISTATNLDPDSSPGDNSTTEDDDTAAEPLISDLRLNKSLVLTTDADTSGGVTAGDTVTFTITVTNDGPDNATGVTVTDQLPTGYSYSSDDGGGAYNSTSGLWTIGNLANGAAATLNIVATVNGSGDYENIAQVTDSDNFDPDSTPGNDVPSEDDYDAATPTTVGDFIWLDIDNDGVQDPTEPGIWGVTVFADYNSNGTQDPGEPSTVTDADGMYQLLVDSPNPTVDIRVDPDTLTYYGMDPTYDLDGTGTPHVATVTVVPAGSVDTADFGYNNLGTTQFCYAVSDDTDELVLENRIVGGSFAVIGPLGATSVEAIVMALDGQTLYGTNGGTFGSINTSTGAFTAIGSVGTGGGSVGSIAFDDIDGLSFDPLTGILWASQREADGPPNDVLLQINPATGAHVPNAFGPGVDYIVVDTDGAISGIWDIDDLAFHPITNELYAIANDGGTNDYLVTINRTNGTVTEIDRFQTAGGTFVPDFEGLSFHNDGTLYGSTGSGTEGLYQINPSDAVVTLVGTFPSGGDYEGLACNTAGGNLIEGTVFFDANADGVLDGGDTGEPSVTVFLYEDNDNDGTVSAGDTLIQTTQTDASGDYSFDVGVPGNFVMEVDTSLDFHTPN